MEVKKLYEYNELKSVDNTYQISNKEIPINLIEDFLRFFNLGLQDLSSLKQFSKNLQEEKRFKKVNKSKFYSLTKKEQQIFELVVYGKSTKEIATQLFIEPTTVSTHRKNIKQKLELESIFDLYKYANAFNVFDKL
ncbi:helix-turn-helix domain-containing protein [Polaribacter sp. L3A8]|uniref:helix-turn-helix domain-containing protein n=1 Tax=Polaribacter sp. L3A8 TaxID=2686361 RepID=UPI00131BC2B3|nr:helix-turn-helix transcriptional regulator [Polaribacter sp. L3A8]